MYWETTEGFQTRINTWLRIFKDSSGCYVKHRMDSIFLKKKEIKKSRNPRVGT
jgi:hypothetical protein